MPNNVTKGPWHTSAGNANTAPEALMALQTGGGGGTFDGMEARVKHLEEDMKEVKTDLKKIQSTLDQLVGRVEKFATAEALGQIKGRVDKIPTTPGILGLIALATLVGGAILSGAHYWGVIVTLPK